MSEGIISFELHRGNLERRISLLASKVVPRKVKGKRLKGEKEEEEGVGKVRRNL